MLAFSALLGVGLIEIGTRVYTGVRWPEDKIESLTVSGTTRGRFEIGPPRGYRLTANFYLEDGDGRVYSHNALGYRGADFAPDKPAGMTRIVVMGASTIYGLSVGDADTATVQLAGRLKASLPDERFEVINAGVPGWTTDATVANLDAFILPLAPDYVIVMDGRNEFYPQLYNNFVGDYSHYRSTDADALTRSYAWQKRLFRLSRTLLFLAQYEPGLFGLRAGFENPVYDRVQLQNKPTAEEIVQNAADASRVTAFKNNLAQFVDRVRQAGATPLLSTMVYDPPALKLGELLPGDADRDVIGGVVARNNEIIRALSIAKNVPLVPGASLSNEQWLTDDCHFNVAGEAAFANLMFAALEPLLRAPSDGK